MRTLYVLYDSRCGICSRLKAWMLAQPAYCTIDFVAAGSARARRLFPQLPHRDEPSELVAITDEGEVYVDDAAWILCLYALVDYRAWSFRLSRTPLRHMARNAWELLSKNRGQLSRMLDLASDAELMQRFEVETPAAACAVAWDGS
jgi:predicted DCC family thiol-disulfide oxidoreductase YuxK